MHYSFDSKMIARKVWCIPTSLVVLPPFGSYINWQKRSKTHIMKTDSHNFPIIVDKWAPNATLQKKICVTTETQDLIHYK